MLEIEFDDGAKIVVNRHTPAREIWVAARSGGLHFRQTEPPGATPATAANSFAALLAAACRRTPGSRSSCAHPSLRKPPSR
ncbi:MAG: iron donor protein CyaY [Burkholderiales bacterium]|nr:iron donor protein CyaY [Burkholderiales bacterium]